jgi:hypothetical protein
MEYWSAGVLGKIDNEHQVAPFSTPLLHYSITPIKT